MYGLILAGGSGSRLWPLSRDLYPKQLQNICESKSLLQETFLRLKEFIDEKNIITTTLISHFSNIKYQLSSLVQSPTILSEPVSKNTAPAILFATKYIIENHAKDPIIAVFPSDHLIKNKKTFAESLKQAESLAEQGFIVALGVKPTYPENGYGYVKINSQKIENGYKVENFIEKPTEQNASDLIKDSSYYWNSGIFVFKASTLLNEAKKYTPEIYNCLKIFDLKNYEIKPADFEKLPNISIDYAIMEKTDKLALIELASDWKDLGSWKSVYDVSKKDANGNVKIGNILDFESKNSLIYSSSKLVATVGLEDIILIETEDAILACKACKVQEVKNIFETLKEQKNNTHLVHKTVYRPWGYYTVLAQGKGFLTKLIHVNPQQKLSLQSHNHRSEHWVVLEGKAKVILDQNEYILDAGQSIDIPLKAIHSLQNPFNEDLKITEVQKGDLLVEEDIVRYEDIYGRV